ncbi:hypothetical protein BaRGS_00035017, partial [Batillaria attramentaria]
FTQTATKVAVTTEDTIEPPTSQLGWKLTIIISVAIAALAATAITFRVVSVRNARGNKEPGPRASAIVDGENQDPKDTLAYHYYWEIKDDELSASSGAPAFACRAPTTPPAEPESIAEGYMTPVPSRAVINNTDGARNVIPIYHNSRCAVRKGGPVSVTKRTQCDTDGYLVPVKARPNRDKKS